MPLVSSSEFFFSLLRLIGVLLGRAVRHLHRRATPEPQSSTKTIRVSLLHLSLSIESIFDLFLGLSATVSSSVRSPELPHRTDPPLLDDDRLQPPKEAGDSIFMFAAVP